jgi:hypothetical protein
MHLLRIIFGWQVEIGGLSIPFWVSWLVLPVARALAYFGFTQNRYSLLNARGPLVGVGLSETREALWSTQVQRAQNVGSQRSLQPMSPGTRASSRPTRRRLSTG